TLFQKNIDSKNLLISGSPIDNPKQIIHLFRIVGIIKSHTLTLGAPNGISELIENIEKLRNVFYPLPKALKCETIEDKKKEIHRYLNDNSTAIEIKKNVSH